MEEYRQAVHGWFGLSYANYLVLPRTLLQSMPEAWQRRFVACLDELNDAFTHVHHSNTYRVHVVNEHGRYIPDPIPHYDRGRAYIQPKSTTEACRGNDR